MKRLFNTAFSGREGDRLPAIIEHLRSLDTQSLPVQLKIIRNLSFLTTDIQKRAEIYGADGLFILLNLLRNTQNRELNEAILPVVDRLSQEAGSSEQLLKQDIIGRLVELLQPYDRDTARVITKILARLTVQEANQGLLMAMNVLDACQALLDFQDEEVRNNVSNILLDFALNAANRGTTLNQSGARALVELLRIDDVRSEDAVKGISNLTQNQLNRDHFLVAGSIQLLIPFFNAESDSIRKDAASALFYLAEKGLRREDIQAIGGVTHLVQCLKDSEHIVALFSSGVLYYLAEDEINQVAISEAGAIPFLISNLSLPYEELRLNAAALLSNLAKIDSNKVAIGEEGGIPILIQCLVDGSIQLKRNAVATLAELVKNEMNHVCIRQNHGIPPLIQCLGDSNEAVKILVARALFDLAKISENRAEIEWTDGILILIQNLGSNAALSLHVASILSHLASDEICQDAIRQANGIVTLLNLLRACDEQTRAHVVTVLYVLSFNDSCLTQIKLNDGMSLFIPLLTDSSEQTKEYAAIIVQRLNSCGFIPVQNGTFSQPATGVMKRLPPIVGIAHIPLSELTIGNKKLGEGGFGVVKAATWLGHIEVVIKKRRDRRQSPGFLKSLQEEAAIHSRLNHPHIVTMYGTYGENETYGLVLEYMSGGCLFSKLRNMPRTKVISSRVAAGIASGLHYLHNSNIVHCDFKSGNILITGNMHPKISDLGHAKVLPSSQTSSLATVDSEGTASWMAPEVLRDGRSSKASDMYSFGVVLWELAMRRMPFTDQSNESITLKIKAGEKPGDVQKIERNASVPYARLITSCWKDRAEERPDIASAEKLLQEMKIKILPVN